jgi:putative spermidine/putrescine transport system ATP-binding protein
MSISIRALTKSFGGFRVSVDLELIGSELLVLAGPSGCGKSSALNLISGLVEADSGSISINGKESSCVPTWKRGIGLVFQDSALFPHLTVEKNIAYGPFIAGKSKEERIGLTSHYIKALRLEGYEHRRIHTLSGGEKQRVAIARSLAAKPEVLLLDEPFSSLDAPLRREFRTEFRELREREGFPCIFVTHDREEAAIMADRIAVMRNGMIVETGTPQELFFAPRTAFVAEFLGLGTVLPVQEASRNTNGSTLISCALGKLLVPLDFEPGAALLVPNDALRIMGSESTGMRDSLTISGLVTELGFEGERFIVRILTADGTTLNALSNRREKAPKPGASISAELDTSLLSFVSPNPQGTADSPYKIAKGGLG